MKHTVYMISDPHTGRFYIGKHSSKLDFLKTRYFGSGNWVKFHRRTRGTKHLVREVLGVYDTDAEAYEAEERFVGSFINHPLCMNMSAGGRGTGTGENHPLFGIGHREESRAKMSKSHKGKVISEETRARMSEARKGENNPNFGKQHSAETKAKIGAKSVGRKHMVGNCPSEETRAKISDSLKGRKLSDEHKVKIAAGNMGRRHSDETKAKMAAARKAYWERRRAARDDAF